MESNQGKELQAVATEEQSVSLTPRTELVATMGGLAVIRCENVKVEDEPVADGLYLSIGSVMLTGPFEWPEDIRKWIGVGENMVALMVKIAAVIKDWDEFRLNGIKKLEVKNGKDQLEGSGDVDR